MAESYILNVKPTISASDGRKMERDLNNRFSRVAKKFGGALKTVGSKLKGILAGTAIAVAGAVVAYPFEKVNASIDETLKKYDDISARAKQLGVSSGELYQATAIAKSAGVEESDFRAMLTAYGVKIGEAKTGQDEMLKEFTKYPIIEGFFRMVQTMGKLKPEERLYFGSKILGEDDVSKLAELINTDVVQRHKEIFGSTTAEQTTRAIEKLAGTEGKQSIMRSRLDVEKLIARSQTITNETIRMQAEIERKQAEIENTNISNYQAFSKIQLAVEESKNILANIQTEFAPYLEKGAGYIEKGYNAFKSSKFGKWFGGVFK